MLLVRLVHATIVEPTAIRQCQSTDQFSRCVSGEILISTPSFSITSALVTVKVVYINKGLDI